MKLEPTASIAAPRTVHENDVSVSESVIVEIQLAETG